MEKKILLSVLLLGAELLSAQIYNDYPPFDHTKISARQNIFDKHAANFYTSFTQKSFLNVPDTTAKTSILTEMGYVLAMETTFGGMSYLTSQEKRLGPVVTGGFDMFMGLAGLKNAFHKETGIQKVGYYMLTAGFIAKALYNFRLNKNHNKKTRFWTNFVGFNVLVFTGYYLDSLD